MSCNPNPQSEASLFPIIKRLKFFTEFVAVCVVALVFALMPLGNMAHAKANPKYASIVMDADTGIILSASHPDKKLHPASTTKIMTLMLTFEAIDAGKASLNDRVKISSHAASAAPSKLGLPPGSSIRLKDAILALVTKSANDIAVALAEHIGGSEKNFAKMMTARAHEIGMKNTKFVNAHGLHDPRQITTVRDMATLARYMIIHHPRDYGYFSTKSFVYKGRTYNNHNGLLGKYKGMDGLKTGFINASGFNLVASAKRDGRRIIGVVFGGRTARSRNDHMVELLDRGFANLPDLRIARASPIAYVPSKPEIPDSVADLEDEREIAESEINSATGDPIAAIIAQGDIDTESARRMATGMVAMDAVLTSQGKSALRSTIKSLGVIERPQASSAQGLQVASLSPRNAAGGKAEAWAIQIGAFQSRVATEAALDTAKGLLPANLRHVEGKIVPLRTANSQWVFRARLYGYSQQEAEAACTHFRDCLAISPRSE